MARTIRAGVEAGVPIVGVVERMGLDAPGGLAALGAWGRIAAELARASGVVPTALVVDGPCLGGPAIAVGLVDLVVMTDRAALFVEPSPFRLTADGSFGCRMGAECVPDAVRGPESGCFRCRSERWRFQARANDRPTARTGPLPYSRPASWAA